MATAVRSMTGSGAASGTFQSPRGRLEISVDIRTVNGRYLDVSIRSPRQYVIFDPKISQLVKKFLNRGRVDVNVNLSVTQGLTSEVRLDEAKAKALYDALAGLHRKLGIVAPITMTDLLRADSEWVAIANPEIDEEKEWAHVESILSEALKKVVTHRENEGESLKKVIKGHLADVQKALQIVTAQKDLALEKLKERFKIRIQELGQNKAFEPQRLEQEIVFWTGRSDFQEEVDRASHHVKALEEMFEKGGDFGKRFEFLLQELQREVNTMGSKNPDVQLSAPIVEMKTSIERMREQIQNVE